MPYVVMVHATFANKAEADHIFNQAKAVAVSASVAHIGEPDAERTSHAFVAEEQPDGSLTVDQAWHVDLFGIVREGAPDLNDPPAWIQPLGAQDAYPALNVRGEETRVTHNGSIWRNTHGNSNVWAPGAFGWEEVVDPE